MEEYVEQRSIGADAWRRTGVLTFDGNKEVQGKVSYGRIQEHLQKVFQRKFSYGTVVELCVAHNRRRQRTVTKGLLPQAGLGKGFNGVITRITTGVLHCTGVLISLNTQMGRIMSMSIVTMLLDSVWIHSLLTVFIEHL